MRLAPYKEWAKNLVTFNHDDKNQQVTMRLAAIAGTCVFAFLIFWIL